MPPPLHDIRVVDLATPRAELAGRTLGELGAEVIKVEPPGGAAARHMPPFGNGHEGHIEHSLYWAAVGLGKKSVVLDIEAAADRERLKQLIAGADILVESFDPGRMAALGLGYDTLSALNPGLVYVSVSPFGQDGPLANAPATDLTLEAAGALLGLQGDGDRPPIPVGYPQASFHAGVQAACDAVLALHERMRSGRGQYLDVSAQAAVVWTLMNATGYPPNTGANPPGYCEHRADPPAQLFPGLSIPRIFEAADGWVTCAITLPIVGTRTHQALMRWLESAGELPDGLRGIDWSNFLADLVSGKLPVATLQAAVDAIGAGFKKRTKVELQSFAAREGILVAPVYTVEDLRRDPQLGARDYWTMVGGRVHPGPFAKLSGTPLDMTRPAPRLGEHQALLDSLAPPRVHPSGHVQRRAVFDGLKVADFAWVGVGPLISKALADHGATVVHVESSTRPDILRVLPPFKDGQPGINRAQFMADFNSSKLGLACDLSTGEGKALARRLVDWADVVVESFTPGNMKKFGLDYATISKDRPDIVMLSTCLRGQTGPEAGYTGFGGQGAALAGIFSVTGWPDRAPVGPWGAYTDFINPRFGVAALTAALIHRQETGKGQYIDLAQSESGIHFIEPLVLDYTVNGRIAGAAGVDSLYAAPHGVYSCQGHEAYVALSCETDGQWVALAGLLGGATDNPAYATLAGRRAGRAAIDEAISAWCAIRPAGAAANELMAAGVPAYEVLWPSGLYTDAQLAHRGFFVTLDHGEMGPTPYDGLVTRFSETPGRLRNPAPCLGQDTDHVLRDILKLSDDEVGELAAAGVLT